MALANSIDANVTGFQSLNAVTGDWNGRTLQAGTGISITNPDGTAGDPSISTTAPLLTEGTFTPTITLGGTPVTSYFTQYGHFIQIGNLMTFDIQLNINVVGAGVGTLLIIPGVLPARLADGGLSTFAFRCGGVTLTAGFQTFSSFMVAGTNAIQVLVDDSVGISSASLTNAEVGLGSIFGISGVYPIA